MLICFSKHLVQRLHTVNEELEDRDNAIFIIYELQNNRKKIVYANW